MGKFGFIAIAGRPNAGKSSFLNSLLQEELCPVTSLPQTTRQRLRGILTIPEGQIVFVDTPGVHKGKHLVNKAMAETVENSLDDDEADVIAYIVDLSRDYYDEEATVARMVEKKKKRAVLFFNKKDIVDEPENRAKIFFEKFPGLADVTRFFISATDLKEREVIISKLIEMLPEGPPHFPDEYSTDANMRFLASEIIRRQVILNTHEEVPHASCVIIDQWQENETPPVISASIVVETSGQKKIMIGEKGKRIKQIRQFSRREIGRMTGFPVKLELFVKVRHKWRDNPGFLKRIGISSSG